MRSDHRLDLAKSLPISEVIDRIGIAGLKHQGCEMVGPCPLCGGRDRFAVHLRSGVFNCRKCGIKGGDQVKLVQEVLNMKFPEALAWLVGDADASLDPAEVERRRAKARKEQDRQDRIADEQRRRALSDARSIWFRAKGQDTQPVLEYLKQRGVTLGRCPPALRCLPDHPCVKKVGGQLQTLHRGPCMVAVIQGADGQGAAVHQTWLDSDQPKGKALIPMGSDVISKLVRGSKKGGAIRLITPPGATVLVMGEGIETTLSTFAAQAVPGAAYWAGVDLGNMAGRQRRVQGVRHSGLPDMADDRAFVPPTWVRRLIYLQDGDSDPKATRAKLLAGCRRAMAVRPGLKAQIVHAGEGVDFNDLIRPEPDHER